MPEHSGWLETSFGCTVVPVFAYLDAGTMSVLGLALAGGVAGVAVVVRLYWHKFLGIFSKKHRRMAEMAEGDLLGVEIDPETGEPVDPEAAAERVEEVTGESSSISDRG